MNEDMNILVNHIFAGVNQRITDAIADDQHHTKGVLYDLLYEIEDLLHQSADGVLEEHPDYE